DRRGEGLDRRRRHADARGDRRAHVRRPLRRGDQHPDDLDLRDQDLGRHRREVHGARRPHAPRRVHRQRSGAEAMKRVQLYDTTLRDGAQAEDISFTLDDKLRIAARLDELGIQYIEGGWPGSNPRDEEFFRAVKRLGLRHAKIAAFGSTRRAGVKASEDRNLALCVRADVPVVTIVGKTWDLHVKDDLRISLAANTEVIHDSIAWLRKRVDEVIFDAEHFFDGLAANRDHALACLRAAADAGATLVCLCDTRGGSLPSAVAAGVDTAREAI